MRPGVSAVERAAIRRPGAVAVERAGIRPALSAVERAALWRPGPALSAVERAALWRPGAVARGLAAGPPLVEEVFARPLNPNEVHVYPNNECAPGEPCGWAKAEPATLAEVSNWRKNMNNELTAARALPSARTLRPRVNDGGVWDNWNSSMRRGTIRGLNEGRNVPVGHANSRYRRNTVNSLMAKSRRSLANPEVTLGNLDVVNQIHRLARERLAEDMEAEEARERALRPTALGSLVNRISSGTRSAAQGLRSLWQRATRRSPEGRASGSPRSRSGSRSRSRSGSRNRSRSRSGSR
jgi:hypothetical protein